MENLELVTKDKFEVMQMPADALEQMNGIELVYPQLKIPSGGGLFWEVDEEPVKEIIGVIVYHKPIHVYFEKEYDGSAEPPRCSSTDGITGKWILDYDENAEVDINEELPEFECRNCADCPYSAFGSAKNGGKACKEKHQLYILTSGGLVPYSLLLPVSSVGALNSYATKLFSKGIYLNGAITSFTLEKATNKTNIAYSKLVLKFVRALTPEEGEAIKAVAESIKSRE